jgi:hypothetical protein
MTGDAAPNDLTALEQLARDDRFTVRTVAAQQRGDRWIARVRCGMKDGASPVWQGEGDTRAEAVEAAARRQS